MKVIKPLVAAVVAASAALPASAIEVVMKFEGIGNQVAVSNFYSGGAGADLNYGVSFTGGIGMIQAFEFDGPGGSYTEGFGQFMQQPSGSGVLTFAIPKDEFGKPLPSGTQTSMKMMVAESTGGFSSFSLSYAASDDIFITPLNKDGTDLIPFVGDRKNDPNALHFEDQQSLCSVVPGSTNVASLCGVGTPRIWATDAITSFSNGLVAYGLRFEGGFDFGAFDDLKLELNKMPEPPPTNPIPEPSTYAMMALGLLGIGFATRRRMRPS
jgi:PEP-CTERM motif